MAELEIFNRFLRDFSEMNSFLDEQQMASNIETVSRKRKRRLSPFADLSEKEFQKHYHFSMENMRRIIDLVRDDLMETDSHTERTNQVPVELQIMSAIRFFAGEHPELVAIAHSITMKTLKKICKRVATALASLASRYIRMPATLSEKESVTSAFYELAHMPQVIGALKQFNVRLQRCNFDNDAAKDCEISNSNGEYLQVQIISDASFKIRNLDCKVLLKDDKCKAKDMFTHTRIKERFEQNEFRGRVLLADDNLKCCSYLFTPVHCPITKEEQAFNKAHAATFNVVNNCFKLWRKRFTVLENGLYFTSSSNIKQTITALALLHNMAIEWNDNSIDICLNSSVDPLNAGINHHSVNQSRSDFIKAFFR